MNKHTPGPWYLDGEYVNGCGVGDSAGHSIFYACCCGGVSARVTGSDVDNMKERLANAQLIVAAPEMLELLQRAANIMASLECLLDTALMGQASVDKAAWDIDVVALLSKIEGGGE